MRSICSPRPLTTMTATEAVLRNERISASPSSPGRPRSRRTRSTFASAMMRRIVEPLSAVLTL